MNQATAHKEPFYKRIQALFLVVASVMISFGSWADTKELLTEIYDSSISHFTNNVEFSHLDEVQYGGNLDFVEDTFGIAKVIKQSSIHTNLEYRYYTDRKYLLALAVDQQRIVAYQVVSIKNTFDPMLPFTDFPLGSFTYSDYSQNHTDYRLDSANVTYFMETHSLGRAGLFLNQYVAYVGYGADYQATSADIDAKQLIRELDQAVVESDAQGIKTKLEKVRSRIHPNVFIVGDIDAATATDMLLTHYEYAVYFEGQL